MATQTPVMPRQAAPELAVKTTAGADWRLGDQSPENFSLVVFYRGLHCPICSGYLRDLERKLEDFAKLGVSVIAISSDDAERANMTPGDWKLDALTIGYGLDFATARNWGLYVSSGVGKTSTGLAEPDRFIEPGLFLVRADSTIYFGSVQTMPFARPQFAEVLKATEFVLAKDYPARGEASDV